MSVKFLLDTKKVKLIVAERRPDYEAMPGYYAWSEELGRLVWIDTSKTRIGIPDADERNDKS